MAPIAQNHCPDIRRIQTNRIISTFVEDHRTTVQILEGFRQFRYLPMGTGTQNHCPDIRRIQTTAVLIALTSDIIEPLSRYQKDLDSLPPHSHHSGCIEPLSRYQKDLDESGGGVFIGDTQNHCPDIRRIQTIQILTNGNWNIEPLSRYQKDLDFLHSLQRGILTQNHCPDIRRIQTFNPNRCLSW